MSYVSIVGSLMYEIVFTKSDIAYIVGAVSKFIFKFGKRVLGNSEIEFIYLKGISKVYLNFESYFYIEKIDGC